MTPPKDAAFSADAVRLQAGDGTEALVVPSAGAVCARSARRSPAAGPTCWLPSPPAKRCASAPHQSAASPSSTPTRAATASPSSGRGRRSPPPEFDGEALPGHGFAAGAAWTVVHRSASGVTCRLDSRDVAGADESWPWPAVLTAGYRLSPRTLEFELEIESRAARPAPLMPGLHPYFPLRFRESDAASPEAARQTCAVWVEAGELWALERGARHGRRRPRRRRPRPQPAPQRRLDRGPLRGEDARPALRPAGRPGERRPGAAGAPADGTAAPGGVTSGVWDRAAGLAVTFEISRAFGTVALYRPPDPLRLSLEPRAALPDALAVAAARPGLPTGLRSLAPGERARFWARLTLTRRPAHGPGAPA